MQSVSAFLSPFEGFGVGLDTSDDIDGLESKPIVLFPSRPFRSLRYGHFKLAGRSPQTADLFCAVIVERAAQNGAGFVIQIAQLDKGVGLFLRHRCGQRRGSWGTGLDRSRYWTKRRLDRGKRRNKLRGSILAAQCLVAGER